MSIFLCPWRRRSDCRLASRCNGNCGTGASCIWCVSTRLSHWPRENDANRRKSLRSHLRQALNHAGLGVLQDAQWSNYSHPLTPRPSDSLTLVRRSHPPAVLFPQSKRPERPHARAVGAPCVKADGSPLTLAERFAIMDASVNFP
jgi:hypothetical protein